MSENEKPDDDKANGKAVTTAFEDAPTDMGDAAAAEAAVMADTASDLPPPVPAPTEPEEPPPPLIRLSTRQLP